MTTERGAAPGDPTDDPANDSAAPDVAVDPAEGAPSDPDLVAAVHRATFGTEAPPIAGAAAPSPDDDGTVAWRALLAETEGLLAAAGIDGAGREARWIVEEATGREGGELEAHLDAPATVGGVAALDRMVERRVAGEPLQYVLGHWPFRGLDLMVDARVLIPRPETEGVVDLALVELDRAAGAQGADAPLVVDLGCGSGAIGLAVAAERPGTAVHLVDVSPDAVAVARANLAGLGIAGAAVTIHEGSWWDPLADELRGRVHVVVSNPPYVAPDDELDAVVAAHEPRLALVPGPTGLEAIEAIVAEATGWLAPGGAIVVEIGASQGAAALALAEAAGLVEGTVRPDLAGRDRALVARRPLP